MRPMDCLHECYSFTFYAPVTLEELMPCKFASQIASVISKHSIWFIRIINTVQRKFIWIQDIILWSTKEVCAAPCLWLHSVRWNTEFDKWVQIYPVWHWIWGLLTGDIALITGITTYFLPVLAGVGGHFTGHFCSVSHHLMSAECFSVGRSKKVPSSSCWVDWVSEVTPRNNLLKSSPDLTTITLN